ncbi:hypothetical protein [Moraxella cuniculi]|uniref:Uncharacterized protein n=1 Tax=Moraxella cuniculi TaxID=34061 RepID=A0A3S4RM34_9GAMM|nr:hypothetical protein [Moraxella cuniculi]VEG13887.1 Uncharacterised protein [Moraxella cuniculi]
MIPFMVAAAALAGVVVVSVFWNEIKNFISASIEKIKTIIIPSAIVGFRTFLESNGNFFKTYKAVQKYYSRLNNGQYQETVMTRTLEAKDLPPGIREKAENRSQADITDEIQQELRLGV